MARIPENTEREIELGHQISLLRPCLWDRASWSETNSENSNLRSAQIRSLFPEKEKKKSSASFFRRKRIKSLFPFRQERRRKRIAEAFFLPTLFLLLCQEAFIMTPNLLPLFVLRRAARYKREKENPRITRKLRTPFLRRSSIARGTLFCATNSQKVFASFFSEFLINFLSPKDLWPLHALGCLRYLTLGIEHKKHISHTSNFHLLRAGRFVCTDAKKRID